VTPSHRTEPLTGEGRIVVRDDFLGIPDHPCTKARRPLPGLTVRTVDHVARPNGGVRSPAMSRTASANSPLEPTARD